MSIDKIYDSYPTITIERITTLWALSEAALGGVLHAFRIPLTGLFVNSSAVIFIALITYFAKRNGSVLKATLIVLLVKAAVSPHTPINAYLAVSLQGILGEFIFRWKRFFKISAIAFGLITLFLSSIQKILVLTIVFGENLWDSIDLFGNYVINHIPFLNIGTDEYQISLWLIYSYIGVHIFAGLIAGIIAGKIPQWLESASKNTDEDLLPEKVINNKEIKNKRKRKIWIKRPTGIFFMILVLALLILTYIYPQFSSTVGLRAIIMVFRSVVIMIFWYTLAGPLILKMFRKYLHNKGNSYTDNVNRTISDLPTIKTIVIYSWNTSKKYSFFQRIKKFIIMSILNILSLPLSHDESNSNFKRSY